MSPEQLPHHSKIVNCLHGLGITVHCPKCDLPVEWSVAPSGRVARRFAMWCEFNTGKLNCLDLLVTESGEIVWRGTLDNWLKDRLR